MSVVASPSILLVTISSKEPIFALTCLLETRWGALM